MIESDNIPLLLDGFGRAIGDCSQDSDILNSIEVVLVDNGSTDDSAEVIRKLLPRYPFARTLRVEVNQGYGYGILRGLDSCQSDYIGWTHADLQTDPGDVIKAYSLLVQEGVFVKGRRRGRPLSDQFFTNGMSVFESLYLGARLYDINAQPNIFPRSFYETWKNPPYDFALDLYALYQARRKKLGIVRFDVDFPERIHGESKWNHGFGSRLKFIRRTIAFSCRLKKEGID